MIIYFFGEVNPSEAFVHRPDPVTIMSTVVQVVIEKEALRTLMDSEFNLCIIRMVEVNGAEYKGNVVFAMVPFKDLRPGVTLRWEDKYQVFETTSYKVGLHLFAHRSIRKVIIM